MLWQDAFHRFQFQKHLVFDNNIRNKITYHPISEGNL